MRRRTSLVIVFALLLAACDWQMYGFGPGQTSFNSLETGIDVANVGALTESWSAPFDNNNAPSRPAVVGDLVYVTAGGTLFVFNAKGETNCSGEPKTCQPLWTASAGGSGSPHPAVVGGFVYVVGTASTLYVFDAAGETNCSGEPKTCQPLWTAAGPPGGGTPIVANDNIYVIMGQTLHVFDALGVDGCSGEPKTCQPLWTSLGTADGVPAVGEGMVYVTAEYGISAYDAAGETNCAGAPKTCGLLWFGIAGCGDSIHCVASDPVVARGRVWVTSNTLENSGQAGGRATAFEADGGDNCFGSPPECEYVWIGGFGPMTTPAIAGGTVYVWAGNTTFFGTTIGLQALDANTGAVRWSAFTSSFDVPDGGTPTVANGVVYFANSRGVRTADAAGQTGCGGRPKTCNSLKTINTTTVGGSVVMAGGTLYVRTPGALRAYNVP